MVILIYMEYFVGNSVCHFVNPVIKKQKKETIFMKKLRVLILTAIAILAFASTAGAVNIGDVVGEAVYSDIGAFINNYPIKSYAIDGQTVMIAEDLRAYGCDVVWDNATRSLTITKSANDISGNRVFKPTKPTGEHFDDILYTDIAVYINGERVPSYAINGYTMITIEEFGAVMDGFEWSQELRAAKAWIDGKSVAEYEPVPYRTYEAFIRPDYEDSGNIEGYFDFNSDGTDEKYLVEPSENELKVLIGDYNVVTEMYEGSVDILYITNLFGGDNWSLAVITNEVSGDPRLRLITYTDAGLKLETFKTFTEDEYSANEIVENHLWLGYADKYYFNVDDNGVLTIRQNTPSIGMWDVYMTYQYTDGLYEFIDTSYYEIAPDFMTEREYFFNEMSDHEKAMWYGGYMKAYTDCRYSGFTIKKGEYFRVTHDDGHNYIFIEKADGNMCWVKLDYETSSEMYNLNPNFFYMAG